MYRWQYDKAEAPKATEGKDTAVLQSPNSKADSVEIALKSEVSVELEFDRSRAQEVVK